MKTALAETIESFFEKRFDHDGVKVTVKFDACDRRRVCEALALHISGDAVSRKSLEDMVEAFDDLRETPTQGRKKILAMVAAKAELFSNKGDQP